MSERKVCTDCNSWAVNGKERCSLHLFNPAPLRKTKKEMKLEAIRKHNEKFDYDKANPKTSTEIIRQALHEFVKTIN